MQLHADMCQQGKYQSKQRANVDSANLMICHMSCGNFPSSGKSCLSPSFDVFLNSMDDGVVDKHFTEETINMTKVAFSLKCLFTKM